MLKENWRLISRVQRIGDLFIVIIAFLTAYYLRSILVYLNRHLSLNIPFQGDKLAPIKEYFFILLIAIIAYGYLLRLRGAYESMRLSALPKLFFRSLYTSTVVFLILTAICFLLKVDISRSFLIAFCGLSTIFLTVERYSVLAILRYWRKRGRNFRNVLICGVNETAFNIAKEITLRPELGLGVKAFINLETNKELASLHLPIGGNNLAYKFSVIDQVEEIKLFIQNQAIDEVIFTNIVPVMSEVEKLVEYCATLGVRVTFAGEIFSIGLLKSTVSHFGNVTLIHYHDRGSDSGLIFKRLFDIVFALLALALLSPLCLLATFLIWFDSRGSIFYRQKRVGLHGRNFTLYKFRSMYSDADEQLSKLEGKNQLRGPVFKISNDPRITRVGRWLRRYSIDEIPQFWNVLRGDMSIVGPRPPMIGEVSLYELADRRRLSMRPGLTCIWQVSGRNYITDFESRVKMDLLYIDQWSFWGDILLILKTVPVVLSGKGAS
jgi:exopolysaccharide biosynthesis polyprenyl glycosylphosphotransferase